MGMEKKSQDTMKMTEIWDSVLYQCFSKYGPGTLGNPQDFQVAHRVKTMIIIILRHYLPFSLLFSFKCVVGFSRDCMTYGVATK